MKQLDNTMVECCGMTIASHDACILGHEIDIHLTPPIMVYEQQRLEAQERQWPGTFT